MNQTQSYMDMHANAHLSSGPSYSHNTTSNTLPQYPQYQQSSVMQPGSSHYGPPQHYGSYGYGNGVTSPQSASGPVVPQVQSQSIQLPAMITGPSSQNPYVPANTPQNQGFPAQQPFDTTGQIAPPGMKPRVTATLWEDEGSLCFQVEAKGVCVARREDNHFINGTKLLNVAGMTRGRRDGILKSEKTRHVVKIGPMHLKGVWIPFERALDFANKEKITDLLYPLFVHNIGGLLYNPENAPRTNAVVAATERRRMDSVDSNRPTQQSSTPSLHHHQSMQASVGGGAPATPHSITSHANAGRPGIDRAHTFPTPPTSASSVMGIGNQGSSYEWGSQNMSNGVAGTQPLSIDTGMNARSMPTTPATTPPGNSTQNMPQYQSQPGYDSKHYYSSTPSSQNAYSQHSDHGRYASSLPSTSFVKTEMGPPSAPGGSSNTTDPHEQKHDGYAHVPSHGHTTDSEGADHHDSGYMHTNPAYNSSRGQYGYTAAPDHQHLSPEISSSPSHQNASGRGTPRTMSSNQPHWAQDYHTPPRQGSSSNLYNVMGNTRSSTGTNGSDNYVTPAYSNASHSTGMTSMKRGREEDEQDRPSSREYDGGYATKRQKTGRPETFGMPLNTQPHMQAIKTGGQR